MRIRSRYVLALVTLAALVVAALALPAMASATLGDSWSHPFVLRALPWSQGLDRIPGTGPEKSAALALPLSTSAVIGDFDNPVPLTALPWSQPATGTLVDQVDDEGEHYGVYNYLVPLTKGQTADFTATFSSDATDGVLFADAWSFAAPNFLESFNMGSNVHRLIMLAPNSGTYVMTIMSSTVGTFSLDAQLTGKLYYGQPSISAPKRVKHSHSFTVSGKLTYVYDAVTSPINFEIRRKSGKKFKTYKTVAGNFTPSEGPYPQTFSAKVKITKKGTYRVRSVFSDAANAKAYSRIWKTVTIY